MNGQGQWVESYFDDVGENDNSLAKSFTENADSLEEQKYKLGERFTLHHEEKESSDKKINEIIIENEELKQQLASLKDQNNNELIKKIQKKIKK